jgi:hypothetical protein
MSQTEMRPRAMAYQPVRPRKTQAQRNRGDWRVVQVFFLLMMVLPMLAMVLAWWLT